MASWWRQFVENKGGMESVASGPWKKRAAYKDGMTTSVGGWARRQAPQELPGPWTRQVAGNDPPEGHPGPWMRLARDHSIEPPVDPDPNHGEYSVPEPDGLLSWEDDYTTNTGIVMVRIAYVVRDFTVDHDIVVTYADLPLKVALQTRRADISQIDYARTHCSAVFAAVGKDFPIGTAKLKVSCATPGIEIGVAYIRAGDLTEVDDDLTIGASVVVSTQEFPNTTTLRVYPYQITPNNLANEPYFAVGSFRSYRSSPIDFYDASAAVSEIVHDYQSYHLPAPFGPNLFPDPDFDQPQMWNLASQKFTMTGNKLIRNWVPGMSNGGYATMNKGYMPTKVGEYEFSMDVSIRSSDSATQASEAYTSVQYGAYLGSSFWPKTSPNDYTQGDYTFDFEYSTTEGLSQQDIRLASGNQAYSEFSNPVLRETTRGMSASFDRLVYEGAVAVSPAWEYSRLFQAVGGVFQVKGAKW